MAPILTNGPPGPFPIEHPDLSFQNILINENFDVVAVLEWSLASTVAIEKFGHFQIPCSPRLPFLT